MKLNQLLEEYGSKTHLTVSLFNKLHDSGKKVYFAFSDVDKNGKQFDAKYEVITFNDRVISFINDKNNRVGLSMSPEFLNGLVLRKDDEEPGAWLLTYVSSNETEEADEKEEVKEGEYVPHFTVSMVRKLLKKDKLVYIDINSISYEKPTHEELSPISWISDAAVDYWDERDDPRQIRLDKQTLDNLVLKKDTESEDDDTWISKRVWGKNEDN